MELPFIQGMFDAIAPRYDFLNRLLSLRRDVYWRRVMAAELASAGCRRVLDAACGTGDAALEIADRCGCKAVGTDFSRRMLSLARNKIRSRGRADAVRLVAGDALALPFKPETFDAVTIAFGIRNIMDRASALKGFHAALRPGGAVAVLELSAPRSGSLASAYLLYFTRALPKVGALFSRHVSAYQYLPDSVASFPAPEDFAAQIRAAGFRNVRWRPLTLGVVVLYIGYK